MAKGVGDQDHLAHKTAAGTGSAAIERSPKQLTVCGVDSNGAAGPAVLRFDLLKIKMDLVNLQWWYQQELGALCSG